MQNVKFCTLKHFGDNLVDKKVRDRAIKDRIDAIKQSHNMKYKFDEEFASIKNIRKNKVKIE